MKRLGINILTLMLLTGFLGLSLTAGARAQLNQPSSSCEMSMPVQMKASTGEHAHGVACKHCASCHVCAHCIGSVALGQGISIQPDRGGWYFDSYTSSFHSIYPPVDSPPPRHS